MYVIGRLRFLPGRLVQFVPMVLGVLVLVFAIRLITPGDPATVLLGQRATPEAVAEINQRLGLDDPLPTQFGRYVQSLLKGDLGTSIRSRQPVSQLIGDRLAVTAWLLIAGSTVTLVFTVPAALWAAAARGRAPDHAVRVASLIGLGLPAFWVGVQLIQWVAIPTGWFNVGGFGDTFAERAHSIALPAITLAIAQAPVLVRSLRASLIDVLGSEYVRAARAFDVTGRRYVSSYLLRNASIPTVTLLATNIGFLLFGAVVVENTFSLPGLGTGMVQAVQQRDFPVVQSTTLVFAAIVLGVNLLADVIVALLDPRVELS